MKENKAIYGVAWLLIILFMGLVFYVGYFTATQTKEISVHPYNSRLDYLEDEVVRGNIYDQVGELLAANLGANRIYPYADTFAHVIGYTNRGKFGIEEMANNELLYPNYSLSEMASYAFDEGKFQGNHVITTLDKTAQEAVKEALGNNKGAVVAMEAMTGQVKVMYSSPTFDPNAIDYDWQTLIGDEEGSPLLNRGTQGLYPPGSIFKIFTSIAYLENKEEPFIYECTGKITKNEHTIRCNNENVHGEIGLEKAFTYSCNTYFIALAEEVSPEQLQQTCEALLFNQPLSDEMIHNQSMIHLTDTADFDTLASYIGQGRVLVTPLHMAMISGIIYNDGILMDPYLIDYAVNAKGDVRSKTMPSYNGVYMDEGIASQLKTLMYSVVEDGTAKKLELPDVIVGGKTGTAQNETPHSHSWFIGFAESENNHKEPLAFAVIVEQGGEKNKALDVTQTLLSGYFN